MYDFRYINKNEQPGSTSYTLLIEDTDHDEDVQLYRIEKVFKCNPNLIDEEFLRAAARLEIDRILKEVAEEKINGNISE